MVTFLPPSRPRTAAEELADVAAIDRLLRWLRRAEVKQPPRKDHAP
jgi:hypothetical protein